MQQQQREYLRSAYFTLKLDSRNKHAHTHAHQPSLITTGPGCDTRLPPNDIVIAATHSLARSRATPNSLPSPTPQHNATQHTTAQHKHNATQHSTTQTQHKHYNYCTENEGSVALARSLAPRREGQHNTTQRRSLSLVALTGLNEAGSKGFNEGQPRSTIRKHGPRAPMGRS